MQRGMSKLACSTCRARRAAGGAGEGGQQAAHCAGLPVARGMSAATPCTPEVRRCASTGCADIAARASSVGELPRCPAPRACARVMEAAGGGHSPCATATARKRSSQCWQPASMVGNQAHTGPAAQHSRQPASGSASSRHAGQHACEGQASSGGGRGMHRRYAVPNRACSVCWCVAARPTYLHSPANRRRAAAAPGPGLPAGRARWHCVP